MILKKMGKTVGIKRLFLNTLLIIKVYLKIKGKIKKKNKKQ